MEPITIFRTVGVAKTIVAYLGLIESSNENINKLVHQSFKSAKQNLEYAENSNGEMQRNYLHKALGDFISSFSMEKDENLINAYLGAATCQHLLGDDANARLTISKIKNVQLSKTELSRVIALDVSSKGKALLIPLPIMTFQTIRRLSGKRGPAETKRIKEFEDFKKKALEAENF